MGRSGQRGARWLALLVAAGAGGAWAHPQGFHARVTFTVAQGLVRAVAVMDVDSGERCRLLRAGFDENKDGLVQGAEVTALKERVAAMLLGPLAVSLSGFPLVLEAREKKLSLHEDPRVGDSGLSVAVLLEAKAPKDIGPGTSFEVTPVAPDGSTVRVEVFQAGAKGAPPEAPASADVESAKRFVVRLGALGTSAP